jgi:hypothetical protein
MSAYVVVFSSITKIQDSKIGKYLARDFLFV